jgi:hypothetical protein
VNQGTAKTLVRRGPGLRIGPRGRGREWEEVGFECEVKMGSVHMHVVSLVGEINSVQAVCTCMIPIVRRVLR